MSVFLFQQTLFSNTNQYNILTIINLAYRFKILLYFCPVQNEQIGSDCNKFILENMSTILENILTLIFGNFPDKIGSEFDSNCQPANLQTIHFLLDSNFISVSLLKNCYF